MSRLHSLWRLLPRDARRAALFGATALLAPKPDRPAPDGAGPLTVAGYFTAPTGLGEAVRRLSNGLATAGLAPSIADLTGPLRQGPAGPPPVVAPGPGTLLVHVNGPMLPWALLALGKRAVPGKRIIAVWNWELPALPRDWQRGFAACHRIWVSSSFVQAACTRPGGPPVDVVPYPVPEPDPSALTRADFGLPADAFVTISIFDAGSSLARKNPLGALAAHKAAFGTRMDRILVLKVHGTRNAGAEWARVAEVAGALPNVIIIDQVLPRRDLWALMGCCDALVSLHRAEGFGFAIAEAMGLGRPVVATGWSGNMDFMRGPGVHSVPVRLVPARDPQQVYEFGGKLAGALWADPDLEAAAGLLRRLAEDPSLRTPPAITFPAPDYAALLQPG